ncbi:phosphoenolpyruvate--protein phosphotransferase [Caulobacter mirabilis]|uniref:phosphoenolpyruvate--protein phosphotransferase n=1 Tax=Caulobacter mirabilis TaxID=69666 RepID=A0A2D2B1N5_9CAUL|nr:phosphoenolpyruvate--protein phosphotransferase [Caulobacter mirabilis]ATQ44126.1 phosphoenolpyruvate--protein phosphotransferase [Caulobacter mirabilis]
MVQIVLVSPLDGWVAPLTETPDPVFAGRMLGDGVAIDPTGSRLHAPCAGRIASIHRARHAVTLVTPEGAEILMHLGLDTVALGGEGFEVLVEEGATVAAGQPLLAFDLDRLSQSAPSLMTPVIVANGEAFAIERREIDHRIKVGEPLMILKGATVAAAEAVAAGGVSRTLVVPLPHGVHARPAARISDAARRFAAEVRVLAFNRSASARSPVGLMSLAIRHGDEITLTASGPDAEAAVAALARLIEDGAGEEAEAPIEEAPAPVTPQAPTEVGVLRGVTAAPGLAIGKAFRLSARAITVAEDGRGLAQEQAALAEAVDIVRRRIEAAAEGGDKARRGILGAHLAFLEDPELTAAARRAIAEGRSAGFAWRAAIGGYVDALKAMGDRRLAERVDDLLDLEHQVLAILSGEAEATIAPPPGSILLAEDLLPSQLMGLDSAGLAGLCVGRGGPTSHVAILAAALGLPALVAAGAGVTAIADGTTLILDADSGLLRVAPDAGALETAQSAIAVRHERRAAARAAAHEPGRMADGGRIEVFANVGSLADAVAATASGAEGCGLLRTEFLFLDRETPPDEDEQHRQYQAIASALEGRPLIVRTLDVGGDKDAPYLALPTEENPALGLRGVRVSLWRPQLLRAQLRAILRVKPIGQCRIMIPMVSGLDELRAVRAVLDEARRDLGVVERVELGVMVETPAAALTADLLAAEADFLSIGTNDLTQYTLAMDRGNAELAPRIDALHPAVLRLIAQTTQGARRHGRWVGVCGGLAADPAAAPILIGLGVTELSATASAVPEIKALVRRLKRDACEALAERALLQPSAEAVRAMAQTFLTGAIS